MIPLLENAQCITDLDALGHSFLNIGSILPIPPGIIGTDDVRLSDPRAPLPGTVTNASVIDNASIASTKINFNGAFPPEWLGFDAGFAAPGDQVELLSNKGVPGGYAPLDDTGVVPIANLPDTIGTVTSVDLAMPAEFTVSGGPVTSTGTITVDWANVPDGSWFGNGSGGSAPPAFSTAAIPLALVPNLDASKITSGTIATARLPGAVGVGGSHAPGLVPDPGAVGDPTDYLGRDMLYHAVPSMGPTYQPDCDDPTIDFSVSGGSGSVSVNSTDDQVSLFYSLVGATSDFQPYTVPFTVTTPQDVWAYAAREGFNNSNVVTTTVT